MLRWRLLLGTLCTVVLVALIWLDLLGARSGLVLLPVAVALGCGASLEAVALFRRTGSTPSAWSVVAGTLLVLASQFGSALWPKGPLGVWGWPFAAFALAVLLAFVGEMRKFDAGVGMTRRLGATVLILAYVPVLLSFVIQLRLVGREAGIVALVSLVVVVKFCDTGAYAFGRAMGRTKLAPTLSPGKTVEGAIGGLLLAALGSWLVFGVLAPWLAPDRAATAIPAWRWLLFALLVGGAGIVGDLAESLLKRDAGQKDSGVWMPGFGGILDMLDSLLAAAPVAYLCWSLGLVGL